MRNIKKRVGLVQIYDLSQRMRPIKHCAVVNYIPRQNIDHVQHDKAWTQSVYDHLSQCPCREMTHCVVVNATAAQKKLNI